jgi:methyltransferase (TIGR00027 family)
LLLKPRIAPDRRAVLVDHQVCAAVGEWHPLGVPVDQRKAQLELVLHAAGGSLRELAPYESFTMSVVSQTAISRSASLVVLARTHLTRMGVVNDPYASQLLPANRRRAASLLRLPGLGRAGRSPSFAYLGARTLFYDEFVADALDSGIRQIVVLAAGYDSRAWRMARAEVTFFEVDLPATQADKRSRAPQGGPIYVTADVTEPACRDQLVAAGFRTSEPAAFTVEGLTMYLTEDQVTGLLRTLAELGGPGSRLGVNFGVGFERPGSRRGRIGRRVMASGGESFRFRLQPEDATDFLACAGWTTVRILTGPQLADRYLARTVLADVTMTTAGFAVEAARST